MVEHALELVDIEAVVVECNFLEAGQDLPRPVVRRPLDDHATCPRESREYEVKGLQRSVRDEDAGWIDSVPLADPLAQRLVAEGVPVEQRGRAVMLDRGLRTVGELLDRQELRGRYAAGKGDRFHLPEWPFSAQPRHSGPAQRRTAPPANPDVAKVVRF